MSGSQGYDRDFSRYNHMSTEKLEEILRADFALPEDEESDMEKILYITEVIARRRAGQPTGRYANADEAWDSFVENYCPEPDRKVLRKSSAAKMNAFWGWKRVLVRVASIAAAFILVVAVSTATASAFGFNLWEWLTGWTREVFSVQDPEPTPDDGLEFPEQLTELQKTMEEHGFPDRLLPTYLPDGYEMKNLYCDAMPGYVHLNGFFKNSRNDTIVLDYYMHLNDGVAFEVQKDDDNPEAYKYGGVTHYIMTNYETYYATWAVDNVVCGISGFTDCDELTQVIDSIYGG